MVRLATNRETGETVAVKCIKKSEMTQEDIDALVIEKHVMRKVRTWCNAADSIALGLGAG